MPELRWLFSSLRFEVMLADFDPRFNGKKPLWFERLYKVCSCHCYMKVCKCCSSVLFRRYRALDMLFALL